MKSSASSRQSAQRALLCCAAALAVLWFAVLGPRAAREAAPPAPEGGGVVEMGIAAEEMEVGAHAASDAARSASVTRRAEGAMARLRVHLAESHAPLAGTVRVALLRGDSIVEVAQVSESESGLFWTESEDWLVLAVEEASLPHWSVGPRAEAGAGPGIPGWTPIRRVLLSLPLTSVVTLVLEEAGHLHVMVRGVDGAGVPGAVVRVKGPGPGGTVRTRRVVADSEAVVALSPVWPGEIFFSPIWAPGGGAISAPVRVFLFAGERRELEIVLVEARGALEGVVLDQADAPLVGAGLSISWRGWAIRSVETDAAGRFLVEGLPAAQVSVALRERPKSPFSVLAEGAVELGFEPVLATPFVDGGARDLGVLRVQRREVERASLQLERVGADELGELRAFVTLSLGGETTWEELGRLPRRELVITGEGSVEYAVPGLAQGVQVSIWREELRVGIVVIEGEGPAPTRIVLRE